MFFRHYQLRFAFAICAIVISHGASINKEIQTIVPHHPPVKQETSMTDSNRSNLNLLIRQHIKIENKTRHIYIAPLAIFDVNQTTIIPNPTTNRITLIIPLILYTDEQIKFIRENNTNQCEEETTKCVFHEVSTETMRVIYKPQLDQEDLLDSYCESINSVWLSYNPLLNQRLLYVNIGCISNKTCLKLNEILHRSEKSIGLSLEYSIQQPEQHQVIIANKHLLKTNIYSSKFVLERDVNQFLQEILDAADISHDDKYSLSQIDIFLLKETLQKQLLGDIFVLTDDIEEKQWNSIYWKNNNTMRPDHLLKQLNKKINSKYLSKNSKDMNSEMDDYVRQIYDQQSFDLYVKYRHLFELHQSNDAQRELKLSLKLKPILAYELNKFNRSSFLIHQTIHMTKRDDIHLVPIRSIVPLKKTEIVSDQPDDKFSLLEQFRQVMKKILNMKDDDKTNQNQLPTTEEIAGEHSQHGEPVEATTEPTEVTVEPYEYSQHDGQLEVTTELTEVTTGPYEYFQHDGQLEVTTELTEFTTGPYEYSQHDGQLEITVEPTEVTIAPGQIAIVTCNVKGAYGYKVTWSKYAYDTSLPIYVRQQGNSVIISPTADTPNELMYLQCQVDVPGQPQPIHAYAPVNIRGEFEWSEEE